MKISAGSVLAFLASIALLLALIVFFNEAASRTTEHAATRILQKTRAKEISLTSMEKKVQVVRNYLNGEPVKAEDAWWLNLCEGAKAVWYKEIAAQLEMDYKELSKALHSYTVQYATPTSPQ